MQNGCTGHNLSRYNGLKMKRNHSRPDDRPVTRRQEIQSRLADNKKYKIKILEGMEKLYLRDLLSPGLKNPEATPGEMDPTKQPRMGYIHL